MLQVWIPPEREDTAHPVVKFFTYKKRATKSEWLQQLAFDIARITIFIGLISSTALDILTR